MRLPRAYTIKQKLVWVMNLSMAVALFISSALFIVFDGISTEQQINNRLTSQANIIANNATVALLFNDAETATEVLAALRTDNSIINAEIHTAEAGLFATYQPENGASQQASTAKMQIDKDIVYQDEVIGYVRLVASTEERFERLINHILISLLVMFVALLGALLVSIRLLRVIYLPIQHLASIARKVTDGHNYSLRATKYDDDELGKLTENFNAMLAEAEQHDDKLEAEVALRSQELRENNRALENEIQERHRAQLSLQESEKKFKNAFYESAVGMALINEEQRFIQVNSTLCSMLGYRQEELLDTTFAALTCADDLTESLLRHQQMLTDQCEHYQLEKRFIHKDGHPVWVLMTASAVTDNETNHFLYCVLQIQDITEARQLSEQLVYQASHDALTGLVNRREFERQLQQLVAEGSVSGATHALCYVDLDQFKIINDSCGHDAGDELLRQLSQLMSDSVRATDTLARLGGDEFGILMKHCSLEQAHRAINIIREMTAEFCFSWNGKAFSVGASIGLVPITGNQVEVWELLQRADMACYAAKDAGRNRIHVFHEEDEDIQRRHGETQWVERINQALADNRLVLYRQAIVPVCSTGHESAHFELLVRMRDESGKVIPPGAFLPAAERFGMGPRIDRRVVEMAFDWLQDQQAKNLPLPQVSINLSGQSLSDEAFLQFVINTLNASKIPADKLCFEVTETAAIANLASAISFIDKIKSFGCLFALDDFGSGLSSFGYLKNLPVDYLKIDGMFVKDIAEDVIDLAMVKSINEIGHVMGKQTIAEFVENDEILAILRSIGVDFAQGYGVGMPEPLTKSTATDSVEIAH